MNTKRARRPRTFEVLGCWYMQENGKEYIGGIRMANLMDEELLFLSNLMHMKEEKIGNEKKKPNLMKFFLK